MNRPTSDPELRDAIRELAPGVVTSTFRQELEERCAKKKPDRRRSRRLRLVAIGAAVVVVLAGVSTGLVIGLGYLRGPQSVLVLTDDSMGPGAAAQGSSSPLESPATTLTGAKAELWAEIQRVRQGVASGELTPDWPQREATQGALPSDPMLFLDRLEESLFGPDLTVYLRDSAEDALPLRTELSAMSGVANVEFVSKDEALQELKEIFADNPEILSSLTSNPLPASLEVWLTDYTQAGWFADQFRGRPEVEEVLVPTEALPHDMDYAYWIATLRGYSHPSDEPSQPPGLETTRTTYGVAPTMDDPPLSSTTTIIGVDPFLSWGEEAVLEGRTIKVEQPVEAPDRPAELLPDETAAYSLVTITNTGSEPLTCAAGEFCLMGKSSGGTGRDFSSEKTLAGHEVLDHLVTLQPGESVTAAVRFFLKQGDHPVKMLLGKRDATGMIYHSSSEWLALWQ